MPSYQDPALALATTKLREAQTRLTNLRREHLERDFVRIEDARDLAGKLGHEVKNLLAEFPAVLRRSGVIPAEAEDAISAALAAHVGAGIDLVLQKFEVKPVMVTPRGPFVAPPGPKPRQPKRRPS